MAITRLTLHRLIYFVGLLVLLASFPLSHFMMGLCAFLLFLNWIAEWNWQEKLALLKTNRQGLLISAFYLVCCIGLIRTDNWSAASHQLLANLPILFAPVVIVTTRPLNRNGFQLALGAFIIGTLAGCFVSIGYLLSHEVADMRFISRFIDHIRFSLCVVLSIVFSVYLIIQTMQIRLHHQSTYTCPMLTNVEKMRLLFCGLSVLLLTLYLFVAQTLTGIVVFVVVVVATVFYVMKKMPRSKAKVGILSLLLLVAVGIALWMTVITYDYFHVQEEKTASSLTVLGNPYEFNPNSMVENGHRIGDFVCRDELRMAWELRSELPYDEWREATLIRYLNSKGCHKDYRAVMALSDEDVRNVERNFANEAYTQRFGLKRSLYQSFFSFSLYNKSHYIDDSSLLQRFELWRASMAVIHENWLLGVGLGDYKQALDDQLLQQHSPIAHKKVGCHNQFITYVVMGGLFVLLYFLFVMFYPFVCLRSRVDFLYVSFFLILFLSMFVEDTLNAQTGRMLFAVMMPFLLFGRSAENAEGKVYA